MTRTELLKVAKPIIFNTPMVRAILDGRKTMTRRIVKPQPQRFFEVCDTEGNFHLYDVEWGLGRIYPPYQVGDILYVRETWQSFFPEEVTPNHQQGARSFSGIPAEIAKGHYMYFYYRADGEVPEHPQYGKANWRPSIHMPKEAARIFLCVKNVKVEQLQDITPQDVLKEGVINSICDRCLDLTGDCKPQKDVDVFCGNEEQLVEQFADLWDSIYQSRGHGWDKNDWVFAYEFKRVEVEEE
jgi:hypothetical protein